jgi:hypothetical protein
MMTARDDERLKAIEEIKSFRIKLPEGWKFDREEANSRYDDRVVISDPEPATSNLPRHS